MSRAATTTERRQRFEALVARAERLIEDSPGRYKVRLAGLALLGYVVIFGLMLTLLALVVGSVWAAFASTVFLLILLKKKLIVVLLVLIYMLVKALWVKVERPQGFPLSAPMAPELFKDLNEMRETLDLPLIHAVLLTPEFNAGVVQTPRLGIFGWQHNTVLLGLPLLLALSRDEARAVLAHELGHLSRNHSRFNGWIYRARISWHRIMQAFDDTPGMAPWMLGRFFNWYAPYFDAMSFALARANEYEADAISVELTSASAAASALVGAQVRDSLAGDRYWTPLLERAEVEPQPERHPYLGLARFHAHAAADADGAGVEALLAQSMTYTTDHSDTHPALRDRLAAIGVAPAAAAGATTSAAREWLQGELGVCIERFDEQWLQRNSDAWHQRFQEMEKGRARRAELAARPRKELEALELWELAALTEEHEGADEALPLFLDYKRLEPEDSDADFVIGRILLARDDASGLAFMKRAAERFQHAVAACEYAYGFALRAGDDARAKTWRERGERAMDQHNLAHEERAQVTAKDPLQPASLEESVLAGLRRQLAARDEVSAAWICAKTLQVVPLEAPLYVLAYKPRARLFTAARLERMTAALAQELELPGETFVIPLARNGKSVARRVRKVGTQIL